jgi:hypothetical protein
LQFIRSKAEEWNIDKARIGAYGNSAGAGTSLWLAFHDDMAELDNPDPVLRESTRLSVVGALAAQATYDILQWPEILNIEMTRSGRKRMLDFYAVENMDELRSPEGKAMRADLDMLGLMSSDDPPLYVRNEKRAGKPITSGHINHHPLHAAALKKRAEEVGLEFQVYAIALDIEPPVAQRLSLVEFFLLHLKRRQYIAC